MTPTNADIRRMIESRLDGLKSTIHHMMNMHLPEVDNKYLKTRFDCLISEIMEGVSEVQRMNKSEGKR